MAINYSPSGCSYVHSRVPDYQIWSSNYMAISWWRSCPARTTSTFGPHGYTFTTTLSSNAGISGSPTYYTKSKNIHSQLQPVNGANFKLNAPPSPLSPSPHHSWNHHHQNYVSVRLSTLFHPFFLPKSPLFLKTPSPSPKLHFCEFRVVHNSHFWSHFLTIFNYLAVKNENEIKNDVKNGYHEWPYYRPCFTWRCSRYNTKYWLHQLTLIFNLVKAHSIQN